MNQNAKPALLSSAVAAALILATMLAAGAGRPDEPESAPKGDADATSSQVQIPRTVEEARGQAKLLHESLHVTLQIMHSRYYREDEGMPLPALTLETVFDELATTRNLEFHWMAVNAKPMSVDHKPRDQFERDAVEALGSGKETFEVVEPDAYRLAGAITLSSQCLKCHLPNRTDTKPRTAALVITVPFGKE